MTATDSEQTPTARPRFSVGRMLLLFVTAVCLYVFAPSIAEVFEAWDKLGKVHPIAIPVILALEAGSFWCMWLLQRIALRTHGWFPVITTQLAGNAFNRITPGGGATGTVLQARMLADAGFDAAKAGTAVTAQSILITAAVVTLPVFAIPAILLGTAVPSDLESGMWIGGVVFITMLVIGALLLATRRPVDAMGRGIQRIANVFRVKRPKIEGLGERLLVERDELRRSMGSRWLEAVGASIGRWAFEYFALLVILFAIGARPDIWLVLLAFVAASVLAMIPFSPGGLGFVEAGLTATLAVSGISAGEALLATLVFRLVSFWLPIPVGLIAAWLFRRRYPRSAGAAA
ncbi:MAG TPA: lysylphosphatidylglycerol synthase transmembrane domain-containing protein [Acidimicrobiia bacterium]|nr:lysylphosphatidylglycerol synthase transmembrane domain-containing protein [Acidimicrobiia bacterium]